MDKVIVLICTHNRVELLTRVIRSLNDADKPPCELEIFVAANACTDDTVQYLRSYAGSHPDGISLTWIEEPKPGKSNALNHAIPLLPDGLIALVDDDHRVNKSYLTNIYKASKVAPEANLYCGRIIPDWDGREAAWLHDKGPYSIYPLPIPHYDLGDNARTLKEGERLPGGGNLCVRRRLFEQVGLFSTDLGPSGHDLNGGEDIDFVRRAVERGNAPYYSPDVVQFHYVDLERLTLGYLIKKAFYRSRSSVLIEQNQSRKIPRYLWRKLATYTVHLFLSLHWPRTRFYLMRWASALGEISAYMSTNKAP